MRRRCWKQRTSTSYRRLLGKLVHIILCTIRVGSKRECSCPWKLGWDRWMSICNQHFLRLFNPYFVAFYSPFCPFHLFYFCNEELTTITFWLQQMGRMGSWKPTLKIQRREPRAPEKVAINPRRYLPWWVNVQGVKQINCWRKRKHQGQEGRDERDKEGPRRCTVILHTIFFSCSVLRSQPYLFV